MPKAKPKLPEPGYIREIKAALAADTSTLNEMTDKPEVTLTIPAAQLWVAISAIDDVLLRWEETQKHAVCLAPEYASTFERCESLTRAALEILQAALDKGAPS